MSTPKYKEPKMLRWSLEKLAGAEMALRIVAAALGKSRENGKSYGIAVNQRIVGSVIYVRDGLYKIEINPAILTTPLDDLKQINYELQ